MAIVLAAWTEPVWVMVSALVKVLPTVLLSVLVWVLESVLLWEIRWAPA